MNFEEAVHKHAEWKIKFRGAIARKEDMDAATIARDDCCVVGQWLHGEGRVAWGARPEFQRALDKHRAFHAEAGKLAGLINARKYAEAEAALGSGTPYAVASNDVGVALLALKKATEK